MSGVAALVWLAGALLLVLGGLRARRLQRSTIAAMALGWLAIFAILFVVARGLRIGAQ